MTVATYVQPDKVAQNAQPSQYAANIDAATAVLAEFAANFAPHEATTPDMTVVVDAGKIQNGATILNVAQQTTPALDSVANSGESRIDYIVISALTGSASILKGTEGSTPAAPAITSRIYILVAEVLVSFGDTAITNSMITDRRSMVVTPMLNENDMASDSQDFPPTQASVKAYVPRLLFASGSTSGSASFLSVDPNARVIDISLRVQNISTSVKDVVLQLVDSASGLITTTYEGGFSRHAGTATSASTTTSYVFISRCYMGINTIANIRLVKYDNAGTSGEWWFISSIGTGYDGTNAVQYSSSSSRILTANFPIKGFQIATPTGSNPNLIYNYSVTQHVQA